MQKIGHRGAKGHLAENTRKSVQKALQLEVDMVEVDVHCCKTGELVVFHDFTVDRMTNGSGAVANFSLEQLKALEVKGGYKIPLLTEVLDQIEGKCKINIELKGAHTAFPTVEIIKDYVVKRNWEYSDFVVSSFQTNELFKIFDTDKNIPIGVLSKASIIEAVKLAKQLHAKNIHPALGIVTRKNLKTVREEGFKSFVWTVNKPEVIKRMRNWGVDGIISDFPDLL